ncbi:MAG TPA: nucleoside monophosphate kinase [Acidimicrobiia bacterium]|nr:nucleoside monophosphate kinase [Acidimicrobiia bacterium]
MTADASGARDGPRLVLLGKQGAGKGTQATRLAERYSVPHVATGDLLRAAAKQGTKFGLEAEGYMNTGDLVPDETVVGVVDEQCASGAFDHGFVLDGFPRTEYQAVELDRILDAVPLDVVIALDVPTEIALVRLAGRRVCEDCGAPYHVDHPPKVNWTCDTCGGKVSQREDDTEAAIERRLELYEREMLPIIQYYRRARRLLVVKGVGTGDEVYARLVVAITGGIPRDLT